MKGLVFERNGEPSDVLSWRDLPVPTVGANEVLVRMRLAPVHPADLHVIRARFGRQPALPASSGSKGVGVVEAVGAEVQSVQVGARVVLLDVPGTWRELVVCPAARAVPVPDELCDEDAAQAMINPLPAWVMTMEEHKLRRGDWLLQTAAGSTIRRLVLQLLKLHDFHTINLGSRPGQIQAFNPLHPDPEVCTQEE